MRIAHPTARRTADDGMRPGDRLHERLKVRLLGLIRHAEEKARVRADAYDDLERLYLNYADPRELADDGAPVNPHRRSIVVPATYAALQTLAAHIYSSWTSRPVLLPLQALSPGDDRAAEALEAVLEAKHIEDNTAVKVWAWILDALKYGQGRVVTTWGREQEEVVETLEFSLPGALGVLLPRQRLQRRATRLRREGPVTHNIPARDYLPDPAVPSWDPQRGQFVGVRSKSSRGELWRQQHEGTYFNVHLIPRGREGDRSSRGQDDVYGQVELSLEAPPVDTDDLDYVNLTTVYVRLIPALWGLGSRQMPEVWVFVLASDTTIIRAEPQENAHGMFPLAVMDAELDVHSLYSPGFIELVKGLQEHMDFLYNARQANIRLGLYMAFLYDPRYVEEADIYAAQPGLRMRVRADQFGNAPKSLSEIVHQLHVHDVTAGFWNDIGLQSQVVKQTLGAPDVMQGMPAPGGHTATEMGGVIQHARTRAGQLAARMWGQGMVQLGKLEISDAQQFLSQPGYYQLADAATRRRGHPGSADGRALLGPEEIQGRVEVAPVDVTSPMRREELGEMWMRLAMTVAQNEILSAKYDADEMFEEAARLLGAKNIRDFKRRLTLPDLLLTRVAPDEQVLEQADRGDLIPLGEDGHADGPTAALMQAAFPAAGAGER